MAAMAGWMGGWVAGELDAKPIKGTEHTQTKSKIQHLEITKFHILKPILQKLNFGVQQRTQLHRFVCSRMYSFTEMVTDLNGHSLIYTCKPSDESHYDLYIWLQAKL